jgi:chorismate mutase/prephenate dehydrogenase
MAMETRPLPRDPSLPPVPGAAPTTDPVLAQLREQITDTDRALVATINKRLELVAQIKRYKAARGLPFLDPDREEWMLSYLARANRGPLSSQGLREIYVEVLDLIKREVVRGES